MIKNLIPLSIPQYTIYMHWEITVDVIKLNFNAYLVGHCCIILLYCHGKVSFIAVATSYFVDNLTACIMYGAHFDDLYFAELNV